MCLFKAPAPPPPPALPEPEPADEILDRAIADNARLAAAGAARERTRLSQPLGLPQQAAQPPATKTLLGL